MSGKLTMRTVQSLTMPGRVQPGRHTDGRGLHLYVRPDGWAGWVLRYRHLGRQRDMSLGAWPDVSLKDAREAAEAARLAIKAGHDPIRQRQRAEADAAEAASPERSFSAAMESAIAARTGTWRSAKHAWQWRATLERHALPVLGNMPVSEVAVEDVMRVLRPIWSKTPETASRLRGRIETVLDHAYALKWRRGENPARWRGNLAELLPNTSKLAPVRRQPALPWQQVPAFVAALRERRGMSALALEFVILTAARTGEVRGADWSEVDWQTRTWIVPAARMKMGVMHRVPLSAAAVDVFERVTGGSPFPKRGPIFVNARGGALSDMAMAMLVRGMARDGVPEDDPPRWRDLSGDVVVPHGFRSSFRDWCGETRSEGREVAEQALAHMVRGVEAAYARSDLLERRRPLMEAWGAFCAGGGAVVVDLASAERRVG